MSEYSLLDRHSADLDRAVAVLWGGGVVAFPTETCYGLAVDPTNPAALARLFDLKQRDHRKPLLLLIDQAEQLQEIVSAVPAQFRALMARFWPGPLTLVFPARPEVDILVTGGTATVGVRISPHPLARELVRRAGMPITATSANITGQPPAASSEEVRHQFGEAVDWIVDAGRLAEGLCSTVCALRQGRLVILRHGQVELPENLL